MKIIQLKETERIQEGLRSLTEEVYNVVKPAFVSEEYSEG